MPFSVYFVIREMGLARLYPCTKFEVSSFTHSKDTAHMPINGWMREGCVPKLARGSSSFFFRTLAKSGINIGINALR